VIGANTRIEIWNGPAWEQYQAQAEQAFADIAEEVLPGIL
jgi:MraZ protein